MAGEILAASGAFDVVFNSDAPIVVSGLAFQPKALFFTWAGRTESIDVSGVGDYKRGFSVGLSSSSRVVIASHAFDGETAAWTGHGYSENDVIFVLGFLFGHQVRIDLTSINVDGFTLTPRFKNQIPLRVSYLAWGGSTITNTAISSLLTPTLAGNQDINVGFKPDVIIALHTGINNTNQPIATSVASEISLGFAAGENIAQGAASWTNYRQFGPQVTRSYCKHLDVFVIQNIIATVPTIEARGRVTQWLSNGFRVNWQTVIGSYRIHFLAMKGGNWFVRSYNTRLDTTPFEIITSRGFPRIPSSSIFISAGNPQSAVGVVDLHDRFSASVTAGASSQRTQTTFDKANVDPSQVSLGIDHNAIYSRLTEGVVGGVTRITGSHYGGWDALMDVVDNAENFVLYLASGGELQPKPAELDSAHKISPIIVTIGQAFEIDTAFGISRRGGPVFTDSTIIIEVSVPTTVVTGLEHLEGQTVCAVIDHNCESSEYIVVSGSITLAQAAQQHIEIGLCYDAELWTFPPVPEGQVTKGLLRNWTHLGFRLFRSHGGFVRLGTSATENPFYVGDRSYPSALTGQQLFTGDVDVVPYGTVDLDGRVKVRVPNPCPFTLLAIYGQVEYGEIA